MKDIDKKQQKMYIKVWIKELSPWVREKSEHMYDHSAIYPKSSRRKSVVKGTPVPWPHDSM